MPDWTKCVCTRACMHVHTYVYIMVSLQTVLNDCDITFSRSCLEIDLDLIFDAAKIDRSRPSLWRLETTETGD